nr:protein of unknown function (DUF1566) [uncultured bacterium]
MFQKFITLCLALLPLTTFANTNLIWSDRLETKVSYYEAVETCEAYSEAGIENWRLPTIQELRASNVTIKDFYWSSTYLAGGTDMVWIFSGFDPHGKIAMRLEYQGIAVRCVAE